MKMTSVFQPPTAVLQLYELLTLQTLWIQKSLTNLEESTTILGFHLPKDVI